MKDYRNCTIEALITTINIKDATIEMLEQRILKLARDLIKERNERAAFAMNLIKRKHNISFGAGYDPVKEAEWIAIRS